MKRFSLRKTCNHASHSIPTRRKALIRIGADLPPNLEQAARTGCSLKPLSAGLWRYYRTAKMPSHWVSELSSTSAASQFFLMTVYITAVLVGVPRFDALGPSGESCCRAIYGPIRGTHRSMHTEGNTVWPVDMI